MLIRDAHITVERINRTFRVLLVSRSRQVGKTTLLREYLSEGMNYVSLDDEILRKQARENTKLFLEEHKWPILIDEVQYAPELFPYIKMIIIKSYNSAGKDPKISYYRDKEKNEIDLIMEKKT